MQKYLAATVIALMVFNYSCSPVVCVENTIHHKFCQCLNVTAENGLIKCKCVDHGLREIPSDLPAQLYEL